MFVVLSGRSRDTHAAHSLSQLGELLVKAGYVSTLLARAPSLHINRPLDTLY